MKNKKLKVSVAIPAHNEEANIKYLLESLLLQKQKDFVLKEIVVYSDGSTDRTVEIVKFIGSKLIKIYHDDKRLGKIRRQNEILELIKTDILVLLDADIVPANNTLLQDIIVPILEKKADLVSGRIIPLPPSTLIERVINFSSKVKNDFFEKATEINGVYLCHGRVRAFSEALYKKLKWPEDVRSGEDAYSYFFCVTNGFKFFYQKKAKVLYRSPNTLADHTKQSVRFIQSKRQMKNYFNKKDVNRAYRINKKLFFRSILNDFISNPFLLSFYLVIYVLSNLLSVVKKQNTQLWEISISSKKLN